MKKTEMIEEIMDYFDFQRVHDMMLAVDWKWVNEGVPSVEVLRSHAREMLEHVAIKKESRCISTGGFTAEYTKEDKLLRLSWGVDWDVCKDE